MGDAEQRGKDQGKQVEAPVVLVTVMEDRAQVRRRASLKLGSGRHVLEVEQVSPLVVDRSLRGGVKGPSGRLVDLGVERSSTVESTRPWLQRELQEQQDRMTLELEARHHSLGQAESENHRLRKVRGFVLQQICGQAGRGVENRDQWERDLEQVEQHLATAQDQQDELRHACEDIEQRLQRLGDRLWAAMQPTVHYHASLRAVVEVGEPGEYQITWDYLVPCALWRPAHQAELQGEERISWDLLGTVWQNTGEDWSDIELRLSTERPTLGAEIPLLEEDRLRLRPKSDEEKRSIEVSSRDEAIEEISPGLDAEARVGVVPGVDDGGEVRVFELGRAVSIPSDGRAHMVTLDSFQCETKLDRFCCPELAETVVLRSRQRNTGERPLLAGPVRLVRHGGFIGRGQISFVAPGEPFALGWGSQDELQVSRRGGHTQEERGLGRRVNHSIWHEVYLSNTGRDSRTVTVTERIPISEVDEVQVKLQTDETTPGFRQTPEGHLVWELELRPGGQQELRLAYQVDAHRKVVWR